MKQWFREFVHNCLCHPFLPFLPRKWAYEWHDSNAKWAFQDEQ